MACEESNVTIAFIGPDNDLDDPLMEIRPLTMNFSRDLGQFDFAKCEFSEGVANHVKPLIEGDEETILNQTLPVVVKFNGTPVHRMLYLPDGVRFGYDSVHMDFHDARKYLERGVVDYQRESVKLEEAFDYVFGQRKESGPEIFKGIKYTVPDESYDELIGYWEKNFIGKSMDKKVSDLAVEELREDDYDSSLSTEKDWGGYDADIANIEEENIYNIIDGHYAVDFNQTSPWEAIQELSEKFGVRTWAAPDGYLYVGSRSATGVTHIAAPDDERVWKLLPEGYNVSAPRDPVIKYVVRGKFVQDPAESWADQATDLLSFVNGDEAGEGSKDFRAEGVSVRKDADYGQEVVEDVDAAKDALEGLARRKLIQKQRQQWDGNLEIYPSLSGTEWTDVRNTQVGDMILTIPSDDNQSDCESTLSQELFEITGVEHVISSDGSWKMNLSVSPIPDGPLDEENTLTYMRYFDPAKEEYAYAGENESYSKDLEEADDRGFWDNMI